MTLPLATVKRDFNDTIQDGFHYNLIKRGDDEGHDFRTIADKISCREIMCCCLLASRLGLEVDDIYGGFTEEPMDLKETMVMISISRNNYRGEACEDLMLENLKVLNAFEKARRLKRTKIYKTDVVGQYIVTGSGVWMYSHILYSFYLLILRIIHGVPFSLSATNNFNPIQEEAATIRGRDDVARFNFIANWGDINKLIKSRKAIFVNPISGIDDAVLQKCVNNAVSSNNNNRSTKNFDTCFYGDRFYNTYKFCIRKSGCYGISAFMSDIRNDNESFSWVRNYKNTVSTIA